MTNPNDTREALVAEAMRLADSMAYELAQSWVAQGFGSGVSKAESTRKKAREVLRTYLVNRLGALAAVQPVAYSIAGFVEPYGDKLHDQPTSKATCAVYFRDVLRTQQEPQR